MTRPSKGRRRRTIALTPDLHAFLDAWQARDRVESRDGNAPISEFIAGLIECSLEYRHYQLTGELPPVQNRRQTHA